MFVYERDGAICVTFKANVPVDAPEYVIVIDEATKTVSVNGVASVEVEEVEETVAPVIEEPVVETVVETVEDVEDVTEEVTE